MRERQISHILSCVAPLSSLLYQLGIASRVHAMVRADARKRRRNIRTWTFVLTGPPT